MNLKLQIKGGWGDGLVLDVQQWRSEFRSLETQKKWARWYMPETSAFLGYWGKGWGISMSLWPSNPDKMTNLRFSETQSTNKVNRSNRRRSSAHSSTHGCICTHTHCTLTYTTNTWFHSLDIQAQSLICGSMKTKLSTSVKQAKSKTKAKSHYF